MHFHVMSPGAPTAFGEREIKPRASKAWYRDSGLLVANLPVADALINGSGYMLFLMAKSGLYVHVQTTLIATCMNRATRAFAEPTINQLMISSAQLTTEYLHKSYDSCERSTGNRSCRGGGGTALLGRSLGSARSGVWARRESGHAMTNITAES